MRQTTYNMINSIDSGAHVNSHKLLLQLKFVKHMLVVIIMLVVLTPVHAVEIHDLVRIKGLEQNELIGVGLVTGLNGTGDSTKKSLRAIRPLAELYRRHGIGVASLDEMVGIDSVALVTISCEVPATGIREGDRLDINVSTVGDAKSLDGGTLIWTVLKLGPLPGPFAKASGQIVIDSRNPRKGIIRKGAQLLRDIRVNPFGAGSNTMTLVLDDSVASFPVADAIANRITQEFALDQATLGEVWAIAQDPKNVVVHLSSAQRLEPASILSQVLTLDIDHSLLQLPARVMINKEAGTILVTGDVEISDVVISSKGLTITRIVPKAEPTLDDPIFQTQRHVALTTLRDDQRPRAARLDDLLQALESLKVPFDDRVAILHEMKKLGVLHAQLIDN